MARLHDKYNNEIVPQLMDKLGIKNRLAVPRLEKIVVNMGVGEAAYDVKILDEAISGLSLIVGQKPIKTFAKKAVAGFKIRAGVPVGCKVTLRGKMMYEFFDRLVNVALARVRDFRGLSSKAFDGRGNYNLGITEQMIFPEIDYDKFQKMRGMDIAIATSTTSDEQAFELLQLMGMPFKK